MFQCVQNMQYLLLICKLWLLKQYFAVLIKSATLNMTQLDWYALGLFLWLCVPVSWSFQDMNLKWIINFISLPKIYLRCLNQAHTKAIAGFLRLTWTVSFHSLELTLKAPADSGAHSAVKTAVCVVGKGASRGEGIFIATCTKKQIWCENVFTFF